MATAALAIGLVATREPLLLAFLIPLLVLAKGKAHWAIIAISMALGLLRAPPQTQFLKDSLDIKGVGRLVTVPRLNPFGQSAIVDVAGQRYTWFFPGNADLSYGDWVQMAGRALPPKEGTEQFLRAQGAVGRLQLTEWEVVSEGPAILRWGLLWRDSFRRLTARTLSPEAQAMADALCFNVDGYLQPGVKDDLRATGTVHIISASGLHVAIFAWFLQVLLSKLPIDRRFQIAVLLLVLIAYMGAAGMRPPVVRAVVMSACVLMGYLVKREGDLLSALGLSTFVQLLWDPWSVLDPGLHLSFMAILGLGLFVRYDVAEIGFWLRLKRRVQQGAYTSVVATLATAPILAWYFGTLSVIGVVSNLVIEPFVAVAVPVAMAAWAVTWFMPLAQTMMLLVEGCCLAISGAVHQFARLRFATVDIPPFSAWWIPLCYLALIGLWRKHARPP